MNREVAAQIRALQDMTVRELRRRWAEVFGEEAPNGHKKYLIKRIGWRIQANADGDISEEWIKEIWRRAEQIRIDHQNRATE